MGQGQADVALEKLSQVAAAGGWLCLQNLHLVTGWLPALEHALGQLKPDPQFRLLLTAEAHPKFTPLLLEMSHKVTYEVINI